MQPNEQTKKRTTIRQLRGADLPLPWAKRAGVAMDEELIIEIVPKSVAEQEIFDLMNDASDEWEDRGGTKAIVNNIIDE